MSHPQQCLRSQVFLDTFSEEFLSALTKFCRPIGLKWPRNNNEPAPSGNNPNPEDRAVASTLAGEMCAVACFSNTVVPCQAFAIVAIPTACCTGNSGIAGFVGCWAAIGAAAFANGVAATGFTYVVVNRCNEALMDCVRGGSNDAPEAREVARKGIGEQQQIGASSRQQNYREVSEEKSEGGVNASFVELGMPSDSRTVELNKVLQHADNRESFVIVLNEEMTKQAVDSSLLPGKGKNGVHTMDAKDLKPGLLEIAGARLPLPNSVPAPGKDKGKKVVPLSEEMER